MAFLSARPQPLRPKANSEIVEIKTLFGWRGIVSRAASSLHGEAYEFTSFYVPFFPSRIEGAQD